MSSKPTKIGNKFYTRWRYGDSWHWIAEEFIADCESGRRYVTALGNKISMHDPRVVEKAYLHGEEAVQVKVKAGTTFAAVAEAYINTKNWGPDRERSFRSVLKNHYKDWANWPVAEITHDHLNAKWRAKSNATWVNKRGDVKPYARNGVIAIMEIGLQVLTYAYDMSMLSGADPGKSRHLAFNRTMKRPTKRKAFTLVEYDAVKALAHPDDGRIKTLLRDWAMVIVMFTFGLRISEICGLNVGDVNLAEKVLVVQARYLRGLGRVAGRKEADEDDEPHVIGFNEDFAEFITPFVVGRPADAPLFPGVKAGRHLQPTRWREKVWTPLFKKAVELGLVRDGIEIVPHISRHSSVTWYSDHLPTHHLQERFDHKTDKANQIYRHPSLEPGRVAMGAVFPNGF